MSKIIDRTGNGSALSQSQFDANYDSLHGINVTVAGTSHTVDIDNQGDTIEFTSSSSVAVTLDEIATIISAAHTTDYWVRLVATGTGTVTITPNAADSLKTGESTIRLFKNDSVILQTSDSTNWNVILNQYHGQIYLGKQTASGSASIDFTSAYGVGSDFQRYRIEIYNLEPVTVSNQLKGRVSVASSFISTTTYLSGGYVSDEMNFDLTSNQTYSATNKAVMTVDFWPANGTDVTRARSWLSINSGAYGGTQNFFNNHIQSGTTQVDGIQFYFSSGNISEGTFVLYGFRE